LQSVFFGYVFYFYRHFLKIDFELFFKNKEFSTNKVITLWFSLKKKKFQMSLNKKRHSVF